jgi:hypothetical protein
VTITRANDAPARPTRHLVLGRHTDDGQLRLVAQFGYKSKASTEQDFDSFRHAVSRWMISVPTTTTGSWPDDLGQALARKARHARRRHGGDGASGPVHSRCQTAGPVVDGLAGPGVVHEQVCDEKISLCGQHPNMPGEWRAGPPSGLHAKGGQVGASSKGRSDSSGSKWISGDSSSRPSARRCPVPSGLAAAHCAGLAEGGSLGEPHGCTTPGLDSARRHSDQGVRASPGSAPSPDGHRRPRPRR